MTSRKKQCLVSLASFLPCIILPNVYQVYTTWSTRLRFGVNPAGLSLIFSSFSNDVPILSFKISKNDFAYGA